jgi:hypothetical protein
LASRGTRTARFGLFWPRYTGRIHVRSVAQTPFQTVSMRSTQTSHPGRVGEASSGAVVATDSASVDADYGNGAAVSHQCGGRWWSNGGYGLVGRRRCPEARQVEEWRTPRTRDVHQGESLFMLPTWCDGVSVLRGHWRHASPLQTQDNTGSWT